MAPSADNSASTLKTIALIFAGSVTSGRASASSPSVSWNVTSSPVGVKNPNTTIANTPSPISTFTRRGTGGMMWTSGRTSGAGA